VTARLVDSTDDTLVWSQLLDHSTDGQFDLEDKVARRVATAARNIVARTARQSA
jgi:TolB-like protein